MRKIGSWSVEKGAPKIQKDASIFEIVGNLVNEVIQLPLYRSSRGESLVVGCRIDTGLHRILSELKENPCFPYATFSDLVRDALFCYAHILKAKCINPGPESAEWFRLLEAERTRQVAEQRSQTRIDAVAFCGNIMRIAQDDSREAAQLVRRQVETLAPLDHYATRIYLSALRSNLGPDAQSLEAHRVRRHLPKSIIGEIDEVREAE